MPKIFISTIQYAYKLKNKHFQKEVHSLRQRHILKVFTLQETWQREGEGGGEGAKRKEEKTKTKEGKGKSKKDQDRKQTQTQTQTQIQIRKILKFLYAIFFCFGKQSTINNGTNF